MTFFSRRQVKRVKGAHHSTRRSFSLHWNLIRASYEALSLLLKTKKKDKIADHIKENGVEPTGEALEDIKYASAAEARETIDFSQGGSLTKELDKVMPYLNATVQGARRPFKYMSENTFGFTSSIVQLAFMGAGMTALNSILAGLFFEDDEKKKRF